MKKINKDAQECKARINKLETTDERITGRGGLSLFSRYLENTGLLAFLASFFGGLRKSRKGLPVEEMFKQILCFFMDGSSRRLSHFDDLSRDTGYAGAIQSKPESMASSHAVKRFMYAFSLPLIWLFRRILLSLFVWRLQEDQPQVVVLGIDLVILNNDDALKREGVKPTYKKVKGFGALNMTWGDLVVDSVLRPGDKHSNHGKSVHRMVKRVVHKIRSDYGDIPIIFRLDSAYMDQSLFQLFEELEVGYTVSGKLYNDITSFMLTVPDESWQRFYGKGPVEDGRIWEYVEFGNRRGTWDKFRRAIFTRPMCDEVGRHYLPISRPCQVIYTNLGMGYGIDRLLTDSGYGHLCSLEAIIDLHHGRGDDELVFRTVKDFGGEVLPFRRFRPNAVYYYCMLISYFLFDCFKKDVCTDVVEPGAYPTTVRRQIIDIGAKIVKHAGYVIIR